jgi:hypothetical protein
LEVFVLDDENVRPHMKRWTSSDISGHGFSYSAVIASKKITVQPESSHPKQFKLEKLVSMTTITATQFQKLGFVRVLIIKARYPLLQILLQIYQIYVGTLPFRPF